jgi:PAS domain S-box-containing protein
VIDKEKKAAVVAGRRDEPAASRSTPPAFLLELADVTRALSDCDQILLTTLERLGRHLGVDRVGYIEGREDGRGYRVAREWRNGIASFVGAHPLEGMSEDSLRTLQRGEMLVIPDIDADPALGRTAETLGQSGARSALCAPLIRGGQLRGALGIGHQVPRDWANAECALVQDVAERTFETLERARVEDRLREEQARQAFLLELSDATRGEADPELILAVSAERLGAWMQVERVAYVEVALPGVSLRHLHEWTNGVPPLREIDGDYVDAWIPERLGAGEAVAVTDVGKELSSRAAAFARSREIAAFLTVPVLKRGEMAATLSLTCAAAREWTAGEIRLALDVAERTWETRERAKAQAKLRETQENQTFLLKLADATRSESDPETILERTAQMVRRHFAVSRIGFWEIDARTGEILPPRQWVDGVEPVPPQRHAQFDAASVATLSAGLPLRVDEVRRDDGSDGEILIANGTRAYLCIPLVKDGRYVATLSLTHHEPRRWSEREVALATEVAERTWSTLQRARAEAELRESQALLSAFMDHAPIGMYLKDGDGRYLLANPEMEKLFGCPVGKAIGRTAEDLCLPAEAAQIAEWDRRLMDEGASFAIEQQRPGAAEYSHSLVMRFPVRTAYGAPARIGGFDIDLTRQKATEAELERSRKALHQSEKLTALGSLLAGVSHELNNPLSVVVGQALIMEEKAADGATQARAAKIRNAAERCSRIVQTFLAMARQREPERQALDLNELIEAALELTGYGLRAAGVQVVRELDPQLPRLIGDASQLHQLFANLIVNAQHALEMHTSRELRISTRQHGEAVIATVWDSGPGIPAAIRDRIFEPFFTTKPVGTGTGLGLSFAYGVAQAHGGALDLLDAEGGTAFQLRLPVAQQAAVPAAAEDTGVEGSAGKVLVVDDEPELAETLAEMLEDQGWETRVAIGGRAAIELLEGGAAVDLVITDLRMPDVDGRELFLWIGAHRPKLAQRIAFLTGDTLGSHAAGFLAETGRPHAEKPFTPESIAALVRAAQVTIATIMDASRHQSATEGC